MGGVAGSETYYLNILPELARLGIDVSFLSIQRPQDASKNETFIERLEDAGVSVAVIERSISLSPLLIRRIYWHVKTGNFDVVQSNLFHADFWLSVVKFFLPQMKLFSLKHGYADAFQAHHGFDSSKVRIDRHALTTRFVSRQADHQGTISVGLKRLLVDAGLAQAEKITVIPYGFSFKDAVSTLAPGEARFGTPQLVSVGRLVPVKQQHLIIKMVPRLISKFPNLKLVLVGDGPLDQKLRTLVERLAVQEYVVFTGFQPNVHDYLRDSDVAVFPSASEGFGAVILEAWHNGVPVVAFDVPAPNEIIEHGETGILVPPLDSDRFVRELEDLLADEARVKRMGRAGHEVYRTRYSLDVMVGSTLAVYRKLASSG